VQKSLPTLDEIKRQLNAHAVAPIWDNFARRIQEQVKAMKEFDEGVGNKIETDESYIEIAYEVLTERV